MRILIEDYSPIWREFFDRERDRLINAIGFANPSIEHIGSTSINNMIAKPIIDILIGLPNEEQLNDIIEPIVHLEYTYVKKFEQHAPNRRFFIYFNNFDKRFIDIFDEFSTDNQSRKFQIHVFGLDTHDWHRHIAMREYLRFNNLEMEAYKAFKQNLSKMDFNGTLDYSSAKNNFLSDLEMKSLTWYSERFKNT